MVICKKDKYTVVIMLLYNIRGTWMSCVNITNRHIDILHLIKYQQSILYIEYRMLSDRLSPAQSREDLIPNVLTIKYRKLKL